MKVSFTAMEYGKPEDFQLIIENDKATDKELAERLIGHLQLAALDDGAYKVDRLRHSLQTADRAKAMGADEDWIFAALFHDVGDAISPDNHAALAAEIMAPYLRPEIIFTIRHHGIFQGHYYWHHVGRDRTARETFRTNPFFKYAVAFCHLWDQNSFDPDYQTSDLEDYRDMVVRVCARKPFAPKEVGTFANMGIGPHEEMLIENVMKPIS